MKRSDLEQASNRREFFRGAVRFTAVSSLATIAAVLVKRQRNQVPGQRCYRNFICAGCGAIVECSLPAALANRRMIKEG